MRGGAVSLTSPLLLLLLLAVLLAAPRALLAAPDGPNARSRAPTTFLGNALEPSTQKPPPDREPAQLASRANSARAPLDSPAPETSEADLPFGRSPFGNGLAAPTPEPSNPEESPSPTDGDEDPTPSPTPYPRPPNSNLMCRTCLLRQGPSGPHQWCPDRDVPHHDGQGWCQRLGSPCRRAPLSEVGLCPGSENPATNPSCLPCVLDSLRWCQRNDTLDGSEGRCTFPSSDCPVPLFYPVDLPHQCPRQAPPEWTSPILGLNPVYTGIVLGAVVLGLLIVGYLMQFYCRNASHMIVADARRRNRRRKKRLTERDYFKGGGGSAFLEDEYLDDGPGESYMTFGGGFSAVRAGRRQLAAGALNGAEDSSLSSGALGELRILPEHFGGSGSPSQHLLGAGAQLSSSQGYAGGFGYSRPSHPTSFMGSTPSGPTFIGGVLFGSSLPYAAAAGNAAGGLAAGAAGASFYSGALASHQDYVLRHDEERLAPLGPVGSYLDIPPLLGCDPEPEVPGEPAPNPPLEAYDRFNEGYEDLNGGPQLNPPPPQ